MSETRTPAFNPATQPMLCKLVRQLAIVRKAKEWHRVDQVTLDDQFNALAQKLGGMLRNKGEAKGIARALKTATEVAFERIVPNTIILAMENQAPPPVVTGVEVLILKGAQHVVSVIPAPVGENGWISCKVPIGTDYDSALLLGKDFVWCQVGEIQRLTNVTDDQAILDILPEGKLVVFDGMTRQGENIFKLEEGSLIYFPAAASHGSSGSALVQLRPLILRKPITLLNT